MRQRQFFFVKVFLLFPCGRRLLTDLHIQISFIVYLSYFAVVFCKVNISSNYNQMIPAMIPSTVPWCRTNKLWQKNIYNFCFVPTFVVDHFYYSRLYTLWTTHYHLSISIKCKIIYWPDQNLFQSIKFNWKIVAITTIADIIVGQWKNYLKRNTTMLYWKDLKA